jgi:hypothetical protein
VQKGIAYPTTYSTGASRRMLLLNPAALDIVKSNSDIIFRPYETKDQKQYNESYATRSASQILYEYFLTIYLPESAQNEYNTFAIDLSHDVFHPKLESLIKYTIREFGQHGKNSC